MLLWIALVLATCGLLARGQEWKLADNFTSAAFCFLIAVDLIVVGSNNRLNNSPGQRDGMPSAVHFLIEKLGPHPLYRIDSTGVWEQWQTEIPEWRIPSANGMDPLLLLSTELYRAPFSSVNGRQFTLTSFQSPLLNLAGIRYIVTSAKRLGDMPRVYHGEVNIFENSGALPRFFLVGGVVASPDAASAVHMIDSGQIDAVRVAVVPSQELAHFAGLSIPGSTAELGKVELLSYAPDQLRLRLETSRPAVLVSTETFWKDWRATVDAKPQTITLVDGIFRGVVVPMGNHEVTMFIRPTVLYVGIAASIAGVLISLLLIVGPNLTKALSRPV
jgi:hypothetical protein